MAYRNLQVQIQQDNPVYEWCNALTKSTNNLYNAALFIVRQLRSGLKKDPSNRHKNEMEVLERIEENLPAMNAPCQKTYERRMEYYKKKGKQEGAEEPVLKQFLFPTADKPLVWYDFLDALMKASKNPDYFYEILPRQTAQNVLKNVCQNVKAYLAAIKKYREDKSGFTGEPQFPKYHKKGGNTTAVITNQQCRISKDENGAYWATFSKTKAKCCLGPSIKGVLKEVHICPFHGIFRLNFVFETSEKIPTVKESSSRICAIDFGVENLAAITNNIGEPFLLFKGGVVKSANQWYNKRMAEIVSKQTKGTTNKFVPTPDSDWVCIRRNAQINDFFHKTAKLIIEWCVSNDIDTIVMGVNKGWKQKSDLGKKKNQEFVEIPFYKFQFMIQYLAQRHGIIVIEQEESYTSKASFLDLDSIPVYQKGVTLKPVFSGYRKGRGNYIRKRKKGWLNADFNGSANIGRKAFPDLFNPDVCNGFNNVIVIKHPDQNLVRANKEKQKRLHPKKSA